LFFAAFAVRKSLMDRPARNRQALRQWRHLPFDVAAGN
jgi:hypothetical protein